jgi:phospholipid transport system substrate-binding protein
MLTVLGLLLAVPLCRADPPPAPSTAQALYDALLAAMKGGPELSFAARKQLLDPEIRQDLDLALMTRIIVGPPWASASAADRQALVEAFSDYSVATYAQRFKSYSGERFEVDPEATGLPSGDCVVHTRLVPSGGEPVQLDYLMRRSAARWRIIDVFLSGTISELAARRSEYATILRQGGPAALVTLLRQKAAALGE